LHELFGITRSYTKCSSYLGLPTASSLSRLTGTIGGIGEVSGVDGATLETAVKEQGNPFAHVDHSATARKRTLDAVKLAYAKAQFEGAADRCDFGYFDSAGIEENRGKSSAVNLRASR
jgi:hypothetical protein